MFIPAILMSFAVSFAAGADVFPCDFVLDDDASAAFVIRLIDNPRPEPAPEFFPTPDPELEPNRPPVVEPGPTPVIDPGPAPAPLPEPVQDPLPPAEPE